MVPDSHHRLSVGEKFAVLLMMDQQSTPAQRLKFRNDLRALPYQDFLKSEYWMIVRNYVVENSGGTCVSCKDAAVQEVHHRSYRHHGVEHLYLDDLMPVCRDCHQILQEKFKDKPSSEVENRLARVVSSGLALADWTKAEEKICGPVFRKITQADVEKALVIARSRKEAESADLHQQRSKELNEQASQLIGEGAK